MIRQGHVVPVALAAVFGGCLLGPAAVSGQATASSDPPLASFAWMPGCWEGTLSNGAQYEEWWMPERGGLMQGLARMTREGRTLSFEFMVLREEDGVPVFTAQPAGAAAPTRFPLRSGEGARWVFENPDHDFPQRVVYANPGVGPGPFARIEGTSAAGERALEFPLSRVPCPS